MLPTEVVTEYELTGLYIWYFEIDTSLEDDKIRLINKTTEEVIEEIEI